MYESVNVSKQLPTTKSFIIHHRNKVGEQT